ncbi:hypothetical protein JST97_03235 [bacterium]|nr:hypothetical protein [bacterium]
MKSPFEILLELTQSFSSGEISAEVYQADLERFEAFLSQYQEKLESLKVPEEFPEGNVMKEHGAETFLMLTDAVQHLREYSISRQEQDLDSGVALITNCYGRMAELQSSSQSFAENVNLFMA